MTFGRVRSIGVNVLVIGAVLQLTNCQLAAGALSAAFARTVQGETR